MKSVKSYLEHLKIFENEYPDYSPVAKAFKNYTDKFISIELDKLDDWLELTDDQFKIELIRYYKNFYHINENFEKKEMNLSEFKSKYIDLINKNEINFYKDDKQKAIYLNFVYKNYFPMKLSADKFKKDNFQLIEDIKNMGYVEQNIYFKGKDKDYGKEKIRMICFIKNNPDYYEDNFLMSGFNKYLTIPKNVFESWLKLPSFRLKQKIEELYNKEMQYFSGKGMIKKRDIRQKNREWNKE